MSVMELNEKQIEDFLVRYATKFAASDGRITPCVATSFLSYLDDVELFVAGMPSYGKARTELIKKTRLIRDTLEKLNKEDPSIENAPEEVKRFESRSGVMTDVDC